MKQSDQVKQLALTLGTTQAKALEMIRAYQGMIRDELMYNREFQLGHVGKFKMMRTPARNWRNPANGESVFVPVGYKVRFSTSSTLKSHIVKSM